MYIEYVSRKNVKTQEVLDMDFVLYLLFGSLTTKETSQQEFERIESHKYSKEDYYYYERYNKIG